MPYIKKERREELTNDLVSKAMVNPGELNYMITQLLIDYRFANGMSYQTINDIVGALEGAKIEFYRRVAAPYEDKKIKENGDVY